MKAISLILFFALLFPLISISSSKWPISIHADDDYTALYTIYRYFLKPNLYLKRKTYVKEFAEAAEKKFPKQVASIKKRRVHPRVFEPDRYEREFSELLKWAQKQKIMGFILEKNKKHFKKVRQDWKRNFVQTRSFMERTARIDFNEKPVPVFITYPVNAGFFTKSRRYITWGSGDWWDNYSTVYLWHELLHSYVDGLDVSHAVIQIITDSEMKLFLNGGDLNSNDWHKRHRTLMKLIYNNSWNFYLESNMNMHEFIEYLHSQDYIKHWVSTNPSEGGHF